jgi:hypothetical protein
MTRAINYRKVGGSILALPTTSALVSTLLAGTPRPGYSAADGSDRVASSARISRSG